MPLYSTEYYCNNRLCISVQLLFVIFTAAAATAVYMRSIHYFSNIFSRRDVDYVGLGTGCSHFPTIVSTSSIMKKRGYYYEVVCVHIVLCAVLGKVEHQRCRELTANIHIIIYLRVVVVCRGLSDMVLLVKSW